LFESPLSNVADVVPVHVKFPESGQPGEHVIADALDGVVTERDHTQVVHVRDRVPSQLHNVVPDQGEVLQPRQIGEGVRMYGPDIGVHDLQRPELRHPGQRLGGHE